MDCLPQGIHPCKVIGAEFLKFVDNSMKLKSELLLRFMDDFHLFSNDESLVIGDFNTIQRLLGEKGLSINPTKTVYGHQNGKEISEEVDEIKVSLLRARRTAFEVSGLILQGEDEEEWVTLSPEQVEYLLNLLKDPDIDESDAELVLVLLRDHGEDVLERMRTFLERFPSLSRTVYNYCRFASDTDWEYLSVLLLDFLQEGGNVTEDQLFWIAKIGEEFLQQTKRYGELLSALYNHPNSTMISRAKILEIPEYRYGMREMREEHLRTGQSDWLSWSAAVGLRNESPLGRNYSLAYFAKGSPMNRLISDSVKELPPPESPKRRKRTRNLS